MIVPAITSRHYHMSQSGVLTEPLVERDHFEIDELHKSGEIGVIPDLGGGNACWCVSDRQSGSMPAGSST